MEGQAGQGRPVLLPTALLTVPALPAPFSPPLAVPAGRRLLAAAGFGFCYASLVPGLWLLFLLLLTGSQLLRLLFSVLLVPLLAALGFLALLRGVVPIGLLIGALAVRLPGSRWPRLLAAVMLPCVDLLLFRASGLAWLVQRLLAMSMDGRTLVLLQFGAPVAASVIATLLVPERLIRRMLGGTRPPAAGGTEGAT